MHPLHEFRLCNEQSVNQHVRYNIYTINVSGPEYMILCERCSYFEGYRNFYKIKVDGEDSEFRYVILLQIPYDMPVFLVNDALNRLIIEKRIDCESLLWDYDYEVLHMLLFLLDFLNLQDTLMDIAVTSMISRHAKVFLPDVLSGMWRVLGGDHPVSEFLYKSMIWALPNSDVPNIQARSDDDPEHNQDLCDMFQNDLYAREVIHGPLICMFCPICK